MRIDDARLYVGAAHPEGFQLETKGDRVRPDVQGRPRLHRLFVAVPMHDGRAAEIRVYRTAPAPPRD
ncbi:MAG: hypothetical protein ACHQ1G_00265 [Planctomycetota bacterium]